MRRLTLRTRLGLLVLAGVLPFIAFNLGSAYLGYREARARVTRQALDMAQRVARSVEAELNARIAVQEVLALSRPLLEGDLATFRNQAEATLTRQTSSATILLLRPDGTPVLNTALPPGAPMPPRRQMENERRVLATQRPSVSDIYFGVVGRPVFAIEVPVATPDGPMVLALNPAPDLLDKLLERERPGPDWTLAVLDRTGVRVTRLPEPERFRAQPVPAEFMEVWRRGAPGGVQEMDAVDGTPSLVAYARIPGIGWGVVTAVPLKAITDPAWHEVQAVLAVGGILLLVGLALARWLSLGIIGPVLALLRLAGREDGEATEVPGGLGMPEADRLAEALLAQARRRHAATAALVESERRLRLVVAELNHRAKNALATVQALALQTARGESGADPQRFTEAFTGRLQTLARAHDLLTLLSWEGAALGAVVRAGLAPWLEADARSAGQRVRLDCPCDLPLPLAAPGQVQALVMAMHELATNASKYGALSVPEGHVEISCQVDTVARAATLCWQEVGGPRVPGRPQHGGFGTRLLERAVARDLGPGAEVALDYDPAGLRATIRFAPRTRTESEVREAAVA